MRPLFFKIYVAGFYKANAGLFLLMLMLLFGILRLNDHILLAGFFLSDKYLLLIPAAIWLMYNFNVLYFNRKTFKSPENNLLVYASLCRGRQLVSIVAVLMFLNLFPVILYAWFLGVVAIAYGLWDKLLIILTGHLILFVINVLYFLRCLRAPYPGADTGSGTRTAGRKYTLPYFLHYVFYTFRADSIKLILSKSIAVLILSITFYLFRSGDYEFSLVTTGLLFAGMCNSLLVYGMHDFYENRCSYTRKLPVPVYSRFITGATTLTILALPDLAAIIRNLPQVGWISGISLPVFYLGLMLLIRSALLIKPVSVDTFIKFATAGFLALTFILLYQPPILLLTSVLLVLSFIIYLLRYYRYDPMIHTPESRTQS